MFIWENLNSGEKSDHNEISLSLAKTLANSAKWAFHYPWPKPWPIRPSEPSPLTSRPLHYKGAFALQWSPSSLYRLHYIFSPIIMKFHYPWPKPWPIRPNEPFIILDQNPGQMSLSLSLTKTLAKWAFHYPWPKPRPIRL